MKAAGIFFAFILLFIHAAHAETTGSISIGQPQSPVMADSITSNMTNQSGIAAKTGGSDGLLLIIFIIVVLLTATAIYLIRQHK